MKGYTRTSALLALAAAAFAATSVAASAQTISWGSDLSGPESALRLSDNTAQGSSFSWAIGWFNDGFTPSSSNISSWSTNWNALETINPINDGGIHSAQDSSQILPSAYGKTPYLLGYNSLGLLGQAGGEAFLIRNDSITYPSDSLANPTFFIFNSPATTEDDSYSVIWGRIDRAYGTGSPTISQGGGIFTQLAPNGTFEVQAGAFVPEPTSVVLGALGGLLAFARRRSRH